LSMVIPDAADLLVHRFESISKTDQENRDRIDLFSALIRLFVRMLRHEEFRHRYPDASTRFAECCRELDRGDPVRVEDSLTLLYCYLHGKDQEYSPSERREMNSWGGYWCHAGGLSPLRRVAPYITSGTRLADYGAGNGLQGLLFQYLYPHQKTTQIELSGSMIEQGRRLQHWMGIPENRVEWLHKNVLDVSPCDFDLIYIYRPVRPEGPGRVFYEKFSRALDRVDHPVTILSIADCLKDFLGPQFINFYDDGQLTCFTNHNNGSGIETEG